MPPIDRISINRPEPDYSLQVEYRRRLARRRQLEAREFSRLVLPSVETQSRLLARKAVESRNTDKDWTDRASLAKSELPGANIEDELTGLAIDIARETAESPSEDTRGSVASRLLQQRRAPETRAAVFIPVAGEKDSPSHDTHSGALEPKPTSESKEAIDSHDAAGSSVALATSEQEIDELSWMQSLEVAFAYAGSATSDAVEHPMEKFLDRLIQEAQTQAAQTQALTSELKVVLESLAAKRMATSTSDTEPNDSPSLQGRYRFLDAFIETLAAPPSAEQAFTSDMLEPASPKVSPERQEDSPSPSRDRESLYEYLELLSSVAGASTPAALQRLAQARHISPEKALMRLAASGDQSVSLYIAEIARRFDAISARTAQDEKKSARISRLGNAIATERQWMEAAITAAESSVGYSAISRRLESDETKRRLAETLPQLILHKS